MAVKNMQMISVEEQDVGQLPWWVVFDDENGRSVLSKCATHDEAVKRSTHFHKVLMGGGLLKADESVWL